MCCPLDQLLAFYDYPCEHWVHLRTTNPIESTFATVRHRSKITKGAWLPGGGPGDGVQPDRVSANRWRVVNASHLVALVRAGVRYEKRKLVERPDDHAPPTAA